MSRHLLDLADACRTSGLPVVETAGWRTRGHGAMAGVRSIVCHHTAGPATGEAPSLGVVTNGRADLPGPLAQLVLGRSGAVYVVAAGLAYHAGVVFDPDSQSNAWAIGIEAEATGTAAWPQVQYDAYVALCAALCRWYGLGVDRVLAHKEVAKPAGRKTDPNLAMPPFRAAVAALLAEPVGPAPPAAPRSTTGDDEAMYILTVLNPAAPKAQQVTGYAILSGAIFIGLDSPGEQAEANAAIRDRGAHYQWVERSTWDRLAAWSHNVVDNPRPVRVVGSDA